MWSSTKSVSVSRLTFGMRAMRVRPGAPLWSSTAIATFALPSAPRPRLPGARGADVGLVDLHSAGEQLAAREHHRATQLVQPRPRRLRSEEPSPARQPNAL